MGQSILTAGPLAPAPRPSYSRASGHSANRPRAQSRGTHHAGTPQTGPRCHVPRYEDPRPEICFASLLHLAATGVQQRRFAYHKGRESEKG